MLLMILFIAVAAAFIYILKDYRRGLFIDFLDNVDANIKRLPAETWILHGVYDIKQIDREKSFQKFNASPFWDYSFHDMIVFERISK